MLRLKRYYGIEGGEHDPPVGVAPASVDWRPWYELALAVASELDESLKVVDTTSHAVKPLDVGAGPMAACC